MLSSAHLEVQVEAKEVSAAKFSIRYSLHQIFDLQLNSLRFSIQTILGGLHNA
jgi:hypothetical protein